MSDAQTNMATLPVSEAVKVLSGAYSSVIESGLPVWTMPSVMLWGPPGIGKSQGVRQIGEAIEKETKKRVVITDVRLLLFNPVDLRGIPTANEDKTLAVWLKPEIFKMDDSADIVNILLLDEISAAPMSVQAAAYQITLDRKIGEHNLPENCIVIAAGNRVTDHSVAVKMPRALANRLCHIEIERNMTSWKEWAVRSGIHEKVLGFLSFRPDRLMNPPDADSELAFTTPRTWEMVSNILHHAGGDENSCYPLIAGCIGVGATMEFRSWCKAFSGLPDIEGIFEGKAEAVPANTDVMYAVMASMVSKAKKYQDDAFKIGNSVRYGVKFPPDFATVLFRDYMAIGKDFSDSLIKIPEFSSWLTANSKYFPF